MSNREPDYAINPLFIERWSSRAYDKRPIPHEELMSLFEAARWSPSAWNAQPWRFVSVDDPALALFGGYDRGRLREVWPSDF